MMVRQFVELCRCRGLKVNVDEHGGGIRGGERIGMGVSCGRDAIGACVRF